MWVPCWQAISTAMERSISLQESSPAKFSSCRAMGMGHSGLASNIREIRSQ
jgi:hypothetical protein